MAKAHLTQPRLTGEILIQEIQKFLDESKLFDITVIDLKGKTSLCDYMVIASGRSQKHIAVMGLQLKDLLQSLGVNNVVVEGAPNSDWILLDAHDVIVHLFRPEVRDVYKLEKMWGEELLGPLSANGA